MAMPGMPRFPGSDLEHIARLSTLRINWHPRTAKALSHSCNPEILQLSESWPGAA